MPMRKPHLFSAAHFAIFTASLLSVFGQAPAVPKSTPAPEIPPLLTKEQRLETPKASMTSSGSRARRRRRFVSTNPASWSCF